MQIDKIKSARNRKHPVFAELDGLADRVRERAYRLFAERGFEPGNELADWLEAERQVRRPAAEVVERDNGFDISIALPGFSGKDIVILATPGEIVVKAAREEKASKNRKGRGEAITHISEIRTSDVYRRFELPGAIDVDKVSANLKNGIVEIRAPGAPGPGHASKKPKTTSKKTTGKKRKKKAG